MHGRVVVSGQGWLRRWRALAVALASVCAALAGLCGMCGIATAAPAHRAGTVRVLGASAASRHALIAAFARGDAGSAKVTAVRPGSVHVAALPGGRQWAIAEFFTPARVARAAQPGATGGIFTRDGAHGSWRLAARAAAPLACDPALPASVRAAWHLAPAVRCAAAGASEIARARSLARRSAAAPDASSVGARIASIALSQVGVSDVPTATNFNVDCDPYTTLDGPEYSAPDDRGCEFNRQFGVENENEEWCSDFAEWVWRQAGITQDMDLINPGANSFYAWGSKQGQPLTIDGTDPQVGDAVVFYEPGQVKVGTSADHVGIVTGVNPDGTVDLVDGDFLGATNISVQYASDVDLKTWASQVWSPGEQWVFVAPPTGAQPATPTATVAGPRVIAAGTEATFSTSAAQAGGSVANETWSFAAGNGVPNGFATGSTVHHVFADPGRHTVTMIATSNLGTITVKTYDVDVVAPSESVASTPSDAVYYNDGPVAQRLFRVSATGALSEESFDGESWLDEALPGAWTPNTPVTTLDSKVDGVLEPHVFGRSASGGLQEAFLSGTTWVVQTLAGSPAAGSPFAAADVVAPGADGTAPASAVVFFYDRAGQIVRSGADGAVTAVPFTRGDRDLAIGTVDAGGTPALTLYARTPGGGIVALTQRGRWWTPSRVASWWQVAPHSALAAVDSGAAGDPGVFFVDRAGHVTAASPRPWAIAWRTAEVSGARSAPAGGLQATEVGTATGTAVDEVAALGRDGAPRLTSDASGGWSTQTLPGSADGLLGLGAYALPGSPQNVLLDGPQGLQADTAATAAGPWTTTTLPTATAAFPDRVLVYAADPSDLAVARSAAAAAGLAPSQVTGDFATAWAAGVNGDYLVITVGGPASTALYVNPCGWTDPSGTFAGSTPFSYLTAPTDTLPGADLYLQAYGSTAADTATLADDLTYYAAHGSLPAGVSTLPAEAAPPAGCAGSPTGS